MPFIKRIKKNLSRDHFCFFKLVICAAAEFCCSREKASGCKAHSSTFMLRITVQQKPQGLYSLLRWEALSMVLSLSTTSWALSFSLSERKACSLSMVLTYALEGYFLNTVQAKHDNKLIYTTNMQGFHTWPYSCIWPVQSPRIKWGCSSRAKMAPRFTVGICSQCKCLSPSACKPV